MPKVGLYHHSSFSRDLKGAFEGLISTEKLDEEASRKLLLPLCPQNSVMADNDGIKKRRSVLPFLGQQRSPVHMPPPSSTADALYPRLDALQGCSQELKLFDVGTNGADTSSTKYVAGTAYLALPSFPSVCPRATPQLQFISFIFRYLLTLPKQCSNR